MTNYNQGKQLNSHHAYARAEMFEEKEETEGAAKNQLAERKRGVSQKKQRRKWRKTTRRIQLKLAKKKKKKKKWSYGHFNWKDFEVHYLIAIREEMDEDLKK